MDCEFLDKSPYLEILKEIPGPPSRLFFRGRLETLTRPCFAIVGSRRPSPYGLRAAHLFSHQLAWIGFCISSGLARGVDAAAHMGALGAGGKTVAVLGHGLDRIYPSEHEMLAGKIVEGGGLLVSEYGEGVLPLKHHFPERNRIISGLAWGTLVIEASEKSGSLITARHALEQNREVFVIPSGFDNTSFSGSHVLIQSGAKLVTCVEDILNEVPYYIRDKLVRRENGDNSLSCLKDLFKAYPKGVSLEELMLQFPKEFRRILVNLEQALRLGLIIEFSPHHFLWVGVQGPPLLPRPCQNAKTYGQ